MVTVTKTGQLSRHAPLGSVCKGGDDIPKDPDEKALWLLKQHKVVVRQVDPGGHVEADVQGSEQYPYRVRREAGAWICTCEARTISCSHVRAVAMVTPLYSELSIQQANEIVDPFEGLVD